MVGGVFDRFPDLQIVFVETEAYWMGPVIKRLEQFTGLGSDWMGFARSMNREPTMRRSPREYWAVELPRGPVAVHLADGADRGSRLRRRRSGLGVLHRHGVPHHADKAMFGVDYPHFESILPSVTSTLAELLAHPAVTDEIARKVLCENAAQRLRLRPRGAPPAHGTRRIGHRRHRRHRCIANVHARGAASVQLPRRPWRMLHT